MPPLQTLIPFSAPPSANPCLRYPMSNLPLHRRRRVVVVGFRKERKASGFRALTILLSASATLTLLQASRSGCKQSKGWTQVLHSYAIRVSDLKGFRLTKIIFASV